MKKKLTYIVLCVIVLLLILLAGGCFSPATADGGGSGAAMAQPQGKVAAVAESVKATASGEVLAFLKPLFTSGYLLIAVGAIVAWLGGIGSGVTVAAFGFFSVLTGMVFAQYAPVALIITACVLLAGGYEIYSRRKANQTIQKYHASTSILAEAVQTAKNGKEVKNKIKAKGADAVKTVRAVVDPIKEELGIR